MGYSLWWRKETAMRLTLSLFLDELRVLLRTSLVAQTVKRLPAVRETRVRFLGWEDPLEKKMAISRTFASGTNCTSTPTEHLLIPPFLGPGSPIPQFVSMSLTPLNVSCKLKPRQPTVLTLEGLLAILEILEQCDYQMVHSKHTPDV